MLTFLHCYNSLFDVTFALQVPKYNTVTFTAALQGSNSSSHLKALRWNEGRTLLSGRRVTGILEDLITSQKTYLPLYVSYLAAGGETADNQILLLPKNVQDPKKKKKKKRSALMFCTSQVRLWKPCRRVSLCLSEKRPTPTVRYALFFVTQCKCFSLAENESASDLSTCFDLHHVRFPWFMPPRVNALQRHRPWAVMGKKKKSSQVVWRPFDGAPVIKRLPYVKFVSIAKKYIASY